MQVISNKNVSFPKLNWGINKGIVGELPKDKKMQEIILAHPAITTLKVEGEDKKLNNLNK